MQPAPLPLASGECRRLRCFSLGELPLGHNLWVSWASLLAQLVKNPPAMQETPVLCLGQEFPSRSDRLLSPVFLGFPAGSNNKESTCNVGDLGSVPRLRRSPGGGYDNPLQYSCLENPHGQRSLVGYSPWVTKSWT